jgi:CheY-like chemotaxis protein
MKEIDFEEFTDSVRDALANLYDHVHLQTHPLSILVDDQVGLDNVSRAQKLRRVLINAIEQLAPAAGSQASAEASFSYSALCYRYMDGLTPEEIAKILGISPRQVYRKLREAVEAVTSLLWDQLQAASAKPEDQIPLSVDELDRKSLAQASVKQLSTQAHPEALEIQSVVTGIVKDLQPYCQQIGLEILLPPAEEALHVYADRAMFRQALLNLLTKGFDRVGPMTIKVSFHQVKSQLKLTLRVNSDPNQTVRSTEVTESERIGWQIGVQLIELQGGKVVQRVDEYEWCLEIFLPLVEPQRVLVIDDMPDVIDLFQRFTARYALEVIGTRNGSEAFDILKGVTPSLILLDVMLPDQDGWEVLQTLKANPETTDIPVIICSILNEPGLAAAIGANGYLRKPVSQEALLKEISGWFNLAPIPAEGSK